MAAAVNSSGHSLSAVNGRVPPSSWTLTPVIYVLKVASFARVTAFVHVIVGSRTLHRVSPVVNEVRVASVGIGTGNVTFFARSLYSEEGRSAPVSDQEKALGLPSEAVAADAIIPIGTVITKVASVRAVTAV